MDATRDGLKGPGYQTQVAETCSAQNEVQLATAAIPQTAAENDQGAIGQVLDVLEASERLPDTFYTDTHYGSDADHQACAARGVDLQAPVPGSAPAQEPEDLTVDDFVIEEAGETVQRCPAGHEPVSSEHEAETGRTRTQMPADACASCAYLDQCPVRRAHGRYLLDHTARQRRLAARRREQQTEAFREHYRIRGGIESTHGGAKRRMGLGRLRCRGKPKVFYTIIMKWCGWNVLRAAAAPTLRRRVAEIMRQRRSGPLLGAISGLPTRLWGFLPASWRLLGRNLAPQAPRAFGLAA
jgi:hypothetical protein